MLSIQLFIFPHCFSHDDFEFEQIGQKGPSNIFYDDVNSPKRAVPTTVNVKEYETFACNGSYIVVLSSMKLVLIESTFIAATQDPINYFIRNRSKIRDVNFIVW